MCPIWDFRYAHFTRMFKHYHPHVKSSRRTEDNCDGCMRFKRLLAEAKTDAEKALFQGQLDQHLSAARGQRRLVTEVCNKAIAARDPKQTAILTLDRTIDTPVLLEDGSDGGYLTPITVLVQAEDYAGSIAMPWYKDRPGSDYFLSNLNLYPFVISDLCAGRNYLNFYDERGQVRPFYASRSRAFSSPL